MGLDDLITEARSDDTRDLDLRSTSELVEPHRAGSLRLYG